MMTGWTGVLGEANGARGAFRSCLRNEFAEVVPSERRWVEGRFGHWPSLGRFGPVGAKARSARVTERLVRAVRVREDGGACRSLVRMGRDGRCT